MQMLESEDDYEVHSPQSLTVVSVCDPTVYLVPYLQIQPGRIPRKKGCIQEVSFA